MSAIQPWFGCYGCSNNKQLTNFSFFSTLNLGEGKEIWREKEEKKKGQGGEERKKERRRGGKKR